MAIPFQCLFSTIPRLNLTYKTIYREKYVLIVNMPSQPLLFVCIGRIMKRNRQREVISFLYFSWISNYSSFTCFFLVSLSFLVFGHNLKPFTECPCKMLSCEGQEYNSNTLGMERKKKRKWVDLHLTSMWASGMAGSRGLYNATGYLPF